MNKKIVIVAIGIIFSIAITSLAMASYSIGPVEDLENAVIRAESPYAFSIYDANPSAIESSRVLMYLRVDGEITEVPVCGYFWQGKEKTQKVYSVWVPDIPCGEYFLEISVQGRAWISIELEDGSWFEGYYGPWQEQYNLNYNIVVLEAERYDSYGYSCCSSCSESKEVRELEGSGNLNEGQKKVLRTALSDELKQRGIA